MSDVERDPDVASAGRRLVHDLENDLAAIRIRADVVLEECTTEIKDRHPLLASDIAQIRETAQQAVEKTKELSRWINDQKEESLRNLGKRLR